MAKTRNYEDIKKDLETAKATRAEARQALKEFSKTNKIKEGTEASEIAEKKTRIAYKELVKAVTASKDAVDKLSTEAKENKPVKERETKYNYPADCTTGDQKKKFRTLERARLKREAKEAAGGGKAKSEKKAEKSEKKSEKKADKTEKKADKKAKKTSDD